MVGLTPQDSSRTIVFLSERLGVKKVSSLLQRQYKLDHARRQNRCICNEGMRPTWFYRRSTWVLQSKKQLLNIKPCTLDLNRWKLRAQCIAPACTTCSTTAELWSTFCSRHAVLVHVECRNCRKEPAILRVSSCLDPAWVREIFLLSRAAF